MPLVRDQICPFLGNYFWQLTASIAITVTRSGCLPDRNIRRTLRSSARGRHHGVCPTVISDGYYGRQLAAGTTVFVRP